MEMQEKKSCSPCMRCFYLHLFFLKCIKPCDLPSYCCRQKDRQAEGWKGGQCQNYIPLPLTMPKLYSSAFNKGRDEVG